MKSRAIGMAMGWMLMGAVAAASAVEVSESAIVVNSTSSAVIIPIAAPWPNWNKLKDLS